MSKAITILHLSDLHFGMEPSAEKEPTPVAQRNNTFRALEQSLARLQKEWHPNVVVVSGDVGWKGAARDYELAAKWLRDKVLARWGLSADRLVLCPGNHDLDRRKAMSMWYPPSVKMADQWLAVENVENLSKPFAAYEKFYRQMGVPELHVGEKPLVLAGGRTVKVKDTDLRFVVVNSAWFCRDSNEDRHNLWLGLPQLEVMEDAGQLVDPDQYEGAPLAVAVMHHPLKWLHEEEVSSHTDRKTTYDYLAERCHVMLTGHVHGALSEANRENNSAYLFKGGATYAEAGYRNNFSLLRIDTQERTIVRHGFEFDPRKGRWRHEEFGPYFLIRNGKVDPESQVQSELESYKQKADSLHASLPVAGFATQLKVPIDVDDIYVPLRAMVDLRGINEDNFADASHAEKCLLSHGGSREIPLPEAFREQERLKRKGIVILGDPGSGKTTHLKRILLTCLRQGPQSIGLPAGMVPVFLPLRYLSDLNKGLDYFIQEQLADPHLNTKQDFGERLLERGNLLFLLDGLDEVAALGQREKVAKWITNGLLAHPSCRFVVTCRFAGYSAKVRLSGQFLEMHVRPLDRAEADRFIRKWYTIVEQGLAPNDREQAAGIAAQKSDKLIERLQSADFRAAKIMELTRNPLLLTNICLVHRYRGGLPKKRARLYEECIDVLLEHWRGGKGLPVGVTAQEGRRVLQPAALWLHQEEGRTRATAEELAPHIKPALRAVGAQVESVEKFLRAIRDESGLLTGWDQERYGFMHLGFQEYLAAREIRARAFNDPSVLRELASHFGESWWQEVSLLLLALEEPSLFEPYMREVLRLPAFVKIKNRQLIAASFQDAAEVSLKPFVELIMARPGDDQRLWRWQYFVLQILQGIAPKEAEACLRKLIDHPYQPIRDMRRGSERKSSQQIFRARKSGYELVRIPGGEFLMGSPENEKGRMDREGPQHQVRVPEFYLGRYPVTNEEYGRFLADNKDMVEPEYWSDRRFNGSRQPVVGVSWHDAKRYAAWAGLRLPSEAEWEYACRAGTTTRYYNGDSEKNLARVGWYDKNSEGETHVVGEKEPNAFGLYDMHGNVWEWVEDDRHDNYRGAPDDGGAWVKKPNRGVYRVFRGGSWFDNPAGVRSAIRNRLGPAGRYVHVGFRLARTRFPSAL